MGTTNTPSGLLYTAFDSPHITHKTDGALPFSFSIDSFILVKLFAAF